MRKFSVVLMAALLAASAAHAQTTFLGKDEATWLKELSDGKPTQQRAAAFALGKLGEASPPALAGLAAALKHDRPLVRDAAAFALGEIAVRYAPAVWRQTGTELRRLLRDDDARVKRSTAFALGNCGE